jgi:hypothetical protein
MKSTFFCLIPLLMAGCTNFSNTVFKYRDPQGATVVIEMPKEIEAKELNVSINAKDGTATITAKEWTSKNEATLAAQAKREKEILEGSSLLIEKAAEGATRGAIKGVIP